MVIRTDCYKAHSVYIYILIQSEHIYQAESCIRKNTLLDARNKIRCTKVNEGNTFVCLLQGEP